MPMQCKFKVLTFSMTYEHQYSIPSKYCLHPYCNNKHISSLSTLKIGQYTSYQLSLL